MGFLMDTCVWIDVERGLARTGRRWGVYRRRIDLPFARHCSRTEIWRRSVGRSGHSPKRLSALARLRRKPLLPIDGDTGAVFGRLAAQLKAAARKPRHRIRDLRLASQAIQHSYRFLTRNETDFADIPGLELVTYARPILDKR